MPAFLAAARRKEEESANLGLADLLPRHPTFRADDLDRACEYLSDAVARHRLTYLGPDHRLDLRHRWAALGQVVFNALQFGGDVRVESTTGDFDVANVNGGIEMREVAGSGPVHTVNGKISVLFARNPAKNCSFKTVNGSIETSFRPGLAADVRVKTFNGQAYTDFDVIPLPALSPVSERRDGKFIYRTDRSTGLRIGNGGPEFNFDTLNGSIRIINRGQ